MKKNYLPLPYDDIDTFFHTQFQLIREGNDVSIFNWSNSINNVDLETMFIDFKREVLLEYYVPKKCLKSPITFLNYVIKTITEISDNMLVYTHGSGFWKYYDTIQ